MLSDLKAPLDGFSMPGLSHNAGIECSIVFTEGFTAGPEKAPQRDIMFHRAWANRECSQRDNMDDRSGHFLDMFRQKQDFTQRCVTKTCF